MKVDGWIDNIQIILQLSIRQQTWQDVSGTSNAKGP
jgi:hypothetical protein